MRPARRLATQGSDLATAQFFESRVDFVQTKAGRAPEAFRTARTGRMLAAMHTPTLEHTPTPTRERNKAAWRHYIDIIDRHALDELDEVVAPDFVAHDLPPGTPRGLDGLRQFRDMVHQAFPDAQTTINDVLADGDKVVGRFTIEATHRGPLLGFAATGKRIALSLIEIARFEHGKIVERWTERDFLRLLQQLGLFPA